MEDLQLQLNSMEEKVKTVEDDCNKLKEENAKYKMRIKVVKQKNMDLETVIKKLQNDLEFQKDKKFKYQGDVTRLEAQVWKLIDDYKNLEKDLAAEVTEKEKLISKIKELELATGKKATEAVAKNAADFVHPAVPIETNVKTKETKEEKDNEETMSYPNKLPKISITELDRKEKFWPKELKYQTIFLPPSFTPEGFHRTMYQAKKPPPPPKNTKALNKLYATKRIDPSVLSSKKKRTASELESDNSNTITSWKRMWKSCR